MFKSFFYRLSHVKVYVTKHKIEDLRNKNSIEEQENAINLIFFLPVALSKINIGGFPIVWFGLAIKYSQLSNFIFEFKKNDVEQHGKVYKNMKEPHNREHYYAIGIHCTDTNSFTYNIILVRFVCWS